MVPLDGNKQDPDGIMAISEGNTWSPDGINGGKSWKTDKIPPWKLSQQVFL